MISRSIHVAAKGIILFFFMAEYYSIVYMYHILFIHSSVDGHLGGFICRWTFSLAIVDSAAVNVGVHVSFWIIVLSGYMPRSGIAGSRGNSSFSFLKEPPYCFSLCSTSLHSHQQSRRFLFSPHPLQHLLFVDFEWWPFWLVWAQVTFYMLTGHLRSLCSSLLLISFLLCS